MPGEDVEIRIKVLHVERQMNRGLTAIDQHWDRQRVRAAARDRFAANRRRGRPPGLTRRIHNFRTELRSVTAEQLTAKYPDLSLSKDEQEGMFFELGDTILSVYAKNEYFSR